MSAADGAVLGMTKLRDAGTPSSRWNLVIVSEGYQAGQMAQFATDAQAVTDRLFQEPPFDRSEIACAINVYRLDVTSTDAGADHPGCSDGTPAGASAATYFDATFCSDGETERLVAGDSGLVQDTVEAILPEWDQILVLINDPERGGAGGSIGWFSTGGSDWREVAIHEMGHSAFNLEDEYDDLADPAPGDEPDGPNASLDPNPATVKWSALVTAGPASPTRANPNCATTDPGPSPVPAGTVGTFEGAKRIHCGVFRPVWTCMMRDTGQPFCPVCTQAILDVMADFAQPVPDGDVVLATTTIDFNDVPTGLTVVRAARFDVESCGPVTVQAMTSPSAPFALESSAVTVMPVNGPSPWKGYFWFRITAGAIGPVAAQNVTLRCLETGEDFLVALTGNVIARPTVAAQLVFDRSASMLEMTDEGRTKEQVLKDSAQVFTDLLWDDNGIGVNAFDHNPVPIMDVETAGAPGSGAGRDDAVAAIAAHASNPSGWTAIGDGIELAKQKLDAAGTFDHKTMIVLTDGKETAAKYISEVADSVVNNKVFAIGMGTAEQIQPAALDALTSGTGGYLLMTGNLSSDETFLLSKYYLQILAGVNNNDLVLDPEGWARPGVIERIPFWITDQDVEFTALVLGRPANYLTMGLETPGGALIALGDPAITRNTTPRTLFMRAGLPFMASGQPSHGGRWHLLLTIHPEFWRSSAATHNLPGISVPGAVQTPGIRYSANVTAYSNLRMEARLDQSSHQPGATLTVRAVLTEYGAPFRGYATCQAELLRPDGSTTTLAMLPVGGEPGAFRATRIAEQAGIYRFHIIAAGRTSREQRFSREVTRTAAVWRDSGPTGPGGPGGPGDPGGPGGPGGSGDPGQRDWCKLLECLLSKGVLSDRLLDRLRAEGVDLKQLHECLCRCDGGNPQVLKALAKLDEMRRALLMSPDIR